MKNPRLLALLALASPFLPTTRLSAASAATPATPAPASSTLEEKVPPERFTTKVLQVISAKDGEAVFRAYLVSWKGQEVIASDALAKSNYNVGDTITVLAMNHPYPQNKEPYRLLAFTIVPPPPR